VSSPSDLKLRCVVKHCRNWPHNKIPPAA
jgi:hypothetical protein